MEDVSLNFEQLTTAFLQLATAQNLALDYGTGTATFTASISSAAATVTHKLKRTPVFAIAVNSTNNGIYFSLISRTATQVQFGGWFSSATTGTFPFIWLAIG